MSRKFFVATVTFLSFHSSAFATAQVWFTAFPNNASSSVINNGVAGTNTTLTNDGFGAGSWQISVFELVPPDEPGGGNTGWDIRLSDGGGIVGSVSAGPITFNSTGAYPFLDDNNTFPGSYLASGGRHRPDFITGGFNLFTFTLTIDGPGHGVHGIYANNGPVSWRNGNGSTGFVQYGSNPADTGAAPQGGSPPDVPVIAILYDNDSPEPASLALMGLGAAVMLVRRRSKTSL